MNIGKLRIYKKEVSSALIFERIENTLTMFNMCIVQIEAIIFQISFFNIVNFSDILFHQTW